MTQWTVAPPGSSVQGIFQARILELPFPIPGNRPNAGIEPASLGIFQPRDQTHICCVSCTGRQILYLGATWEALERQHLLPSVPSLKPIENFKESASNAGDPGSVNKACLGSAKRQIDLDTHLPEFWVCIQTLTGFSHIYCPDGLNNTSLSQGSVLGTPRWSSGWDFHCRGHSSIPGQERKIPHATGN